MSSFPSNADTTMSTGTSLGIAKKRKKKRRKVRKENNGKWSKEIQAPRTTPKTRATNHHGQSRPPTAKNATSRRKPQDHPKEKNQNQTRAKEPQRKTIQLKKIRKKEK